MIFLTLPHSPRTGTSVDMPWRHVYSGCLADLSWLTMNPPKRIKQGWPQRTS